MSNATTVMQQIVNKYTNVNIENTKAKQGVRAVHYLMSLLQRNRKRLRFTLKLLPPEALQLDRLAMLPQEYQSQQKTRCRLI